MAGTLVNGHPQEWIPADDRGLAYGDGLFETIRVAGGNPLHLDRHLARLQRGCQRLAMPCPADIRGQIAHLLARQGAEAEGVIKLILTRGSGPRGYALPAKANPNLVLRWYAAPPAQASQGQNGIRAVISSVRLARQPLLAGIKHLNRLEQVLARAALPADAQEAVMLDTEELVVEGIFSNLFLVRQGELITPALEYCGIEGIARERILEAAAARGVVVRVEPVPAAWLEDAEAILFTNSLIGIWPVTELEGRPIGQSRRWADRIRGWLGEAGGVAG